MSNRNHPKANLDTGPKAPAKDVALDEVVKDEAPASSGMQIETRFEVVDNTQAEAAPDPEAESSERQLDNGMTVVDYV